MKRTSTMKFLLTGYNGLLGTELRKHLDCTRVDWACPRMPEDSEEYNGLIHAAAWTDVLGAEEQHIACEHSNIALTKTLCWSAWMASLPLIYIQSEYASELAPYQYAWSKWKAERVIHKRIKACTLRSALIIRELHKPRPYPHPVVPEACVTGGDYVDVMAPLIAEAIKRFVSHGERGQATRVHVHTGPKTLEKLALQTRPVEVIDAQELPFVPLNSFVDPPLYLGQRKEL